MNAWRRLGTLGLAVVLVATMVLPMGAAGIPAPPASKGSLEFKWSSPSKQPLVLEPIDVVHDSAGNVYVADEAGFIAKYKTDGTFVRYIGAPGSLPATQTIWDPHGLTVDTSGTIYATDYDRGTVFQYTVDGAFVREFGDMCCPVQPAVDPDGNVYVADDDGYVYKYDAAGEWVSTWESWYGEGDYAFCTPSGVAVDASGTVWVADECDSDGDHMYGYDADGNELKYIDGWDQSNGYFEYLQRLHVAPDGALWAGGGYADTAWRFDTETLQGVSPSGVITGGNNVMGVSAGSDGTLWATFTDTPALWRAHLDPGSMIVPNALPTAKAKSKVAAPAAASIDPAGKASDKDKKDEKGSPCGGTSKRSSDVSALKGAALSSSAISVAALTDYVWTQDGLISGPDPDSLGGLSYPGQVSVSPTGGVWVADQGNNTLQVFDPATGAALNRFTSVPGPYYISHSSTGTAFVSQGWENTISMVDAAGNVLGTLGEGGTEPGQFQCAAGLDFDSAGNLYVADNYNNRIQKLSTSGVWTVIGNGNGQADDQFNYPYDVAVGPDDSFYVADSSNNRIVKYSAAGSVVATWGVSGSEPGQFSYPTGVEVDKSGRVFVDDGGNNRVQVFTADGTFIGAYSHVGPENGKWLGLGGMGIDGNGAVYVADGDGRRLIKYQFKLGTEPERIGGKDRYEVASGAAQEAFGDWTGVKHVVIASGDERAIADTVAAAGLCGAYDAPLLLVRSNHVPAATAETIRAIVAKNGRITVHVVGGTGSVPKAILDSLARSTGRNTLVFDRIKSNGDRYDMAGAIAARMKKVLGSRMGKSVYVANGTTPAIYDAVGLAAVIAKTHSPVVYTQRWSVPAATWSAVEAVAPTRRFVVGRPARVSDLVRNVLRVPTRNRITGANAYQNAVAIADRAVAEGWLQAKKVGVAFALTDIASAGPSLGQTGAPLLLTAGDVLPPETAGWLSRNKSTVKECLVYGGAGTVKPAVFDAVAAALQ
jgi:tripartite motif-containing protein 71